MLMIEHDLTAGGRPVLRVDGDTQRDGLPLCYLSVSVRASGFNSTHLNNIFLGMTEDELRQLRDAVTDMLGVMDCH